MVGKNRIVNKDYKRYSQCNRAAKDALGVYIITDMKARGFLFHVQPRRNCGEFVANQEGIGYKYVAARESTRDPCKSRCP